VPRSHSGDVTSLSLPSWTPTQSGAQPWSGQGTGGGKQGACAAVHAAPVVDLRLLLVLVTVWESTAGSRPWGPSSCCPRLQPTRAAPTPEPPVASSTHTLMSVSLRRDVDRSPKWKLQLEFRAEGLGPVDLRRSCSVDAMDFRRRGAAPAPDPAVTPAPTAPVLNPAPPRAWLAPAGEGDGADTVLGTIGSSAGRACEGRTAGSTALPAPASAPTPVPARALLVLRLRVERAGVRCTLDCRCEGGVANAAPRCWWYGAGLGWDPGGLPSSCFLGSRMAVAGGAAPSLSQYISTLVMRRGGGVRRETSTPHTSVAGGSRVGARATSPCQECACSEGQQVELSQGSVGLSALLCSQPPPSPHTTPSTKSHPPRVTALRL
jgi:hypothetical protein